MGFTGIIQFIMTIGAALYILRMLSKKFGFLKTVVVVVGSTVTGFFGGYGFAILYCGEDFNTQCALIVMFTIPVGLVISWVIGFFLLYRFSSKKKNHEIQDFIKSKNSDSAL